MNAWTTRIIRLIIFIYIKLGWSLVDVEVLENNSPDALCVEKVVGPCRD